MRYCTCRWYSVPTGSSQSINIYLLQAAETTAKMEVTESSDLQTEIDNVIAGKSCI